MASQSNERKDPLPGRMEVLRNLPTDILRDLSKEEIHAFLYEEEWPLSLQEKLAVYLVDDP